MIDLTMKIIYPATGESRDGKQVIDLKPGTVGEYVCHVPLGMVVIRIDGEEWVIHPAATDIR